MSTEQVCGAPGPDQCWCDMRAGHPVEAGHFDTWAQVEWA